MPLEEAKALWATLNEVLGTPNPKAADLKACLELAGRNSRCLPELPNPTAYRAQKKNTWQQDLCALLGLALAGFQAHAAVHLQPAPEEAPEESPMAVDEETEEDAPEEDVLMAELADGD